jgi:hypothetical protein
LCFGDQGPELGPHPVAQVDLRGAFTEHTGWSISSIGSERIETRFHDNGASAWLATVRRV